MEGKHLQSKTIVSLFFGIVIGSIFIYKGTYLGDNIYFTGILSSSPSYINENSSLVCPTTNSSPCPACFLSLQATTEKTINISGDEYSFCLRHTADGTFNASGYWNWDHNVKNCKYSLFSREEGLQILGTHKIVLVGDSQSRYFFSNIVNVLSGGQGKPGREKRDSDVWRSPLGGTITWPTSSQFSSMLADHLSSFMSNDDYNDADIWVVTNGHWDAAFKSLADFKQFFPVCLKALRALSERILPSGRKPLVIWHSPNAISKEVFYGFGTREQIIHQWGGYDRPIILDDINDYVRSTGLFNASEGSIALLDFHKLATMRRDWIRDDVVHGSDQCYKFGWQLLLNIIRVHDHYEDIKTPQVKELLDFFSMEGTRRNSDIPWYRMLRQDVETNPII